MELALQNRDEKRVEAYFQQVFKANIWFNDAASMLSPRKLNQQSQTSLFTTKINK